MKCTRGTTTGQHGAAESRRRPFRSQKSAERRGDPEHGNETTWHDIEGARRPIKIRRLSQQQWKRSGSPWTTGPAPARTRTTEAMMPRGVSKDAESFREFLEKGVILVDGEAEGSIDIDDDDPVFVSIVVNVTGYGPNTGAIYAMQNRFHGNSDEPLQAAYEILEEWEREHNPDYYEKLENEYGEDASDVATETFDGMSWELSAKDFVDAIEGTEATKYIDTHSSQEEED